MAMTINTNIASLNAQRNLNKTQGVLNRSLERLSSGLRINSAKDDAAGLAISTRFSAQISGLNQSVRNANDGISMLQTSEGAMQEVTTILQRMREIGVQAANNTYSASDRASLQGEMDQLYYEIDRISESTQFNGISLLDGTGGTRDFQIGANSGQSISVTLQSVAGKDLDLTMKPTGEVTGSTRAAGTYTNSSVTINGTNVDLSSADDAKEIAELINAKSSTTDVGANAFNTVNATSTGTGTGGATGLSINSVSISRAGTNADLVVNINKKKTETGVTATLNTDKTITLSNYNGEDIVLSGDATAAGFAASGTFAGFVAMNDSAGNTISFTDNANLGLSSGTFTGATTVGQGLSVRTVAKANDVLDIVDAALNKVSANRAEMGAVQNRLDSTISNLMNVGENLSAANGRIMDADFAAETSNMTKQQILVQAGVAMLAQAKQLPQQVLQLLQ
jgi:flagellin